MGTLALIGLGSNVGDRQTHLNQAVAGLDLNREQTFEVIGVAKAKGSVFGQSQDNFVTIPAETYFKIYGSRLGLSYAFLAQDRSQLEQAQDEVRDLDALLLVRGAAAVGHSAATFAAKWARSGTARSWAVMSR